MMRAEETSILECVDGIEYECKHPRKTEENSEGDMVLHKPLRFIDRSGPGRI